MEMECLRVLELYSGIGGMHFALKESGVAAQVVAAVDINTTANQIYKHNFPDMTLWPKTIEGITLEEFNKLSFDMILMSPPCQPFTRIGLQRDTADPRTKSFLYILDLLPRLARLPRFILLENVKGFETSSARESLLTTLKQCGYTFQEFLISPTSIGIPNSRLRYFLIAKASSGIFSFQRSSEILKGFPQAAQGTPRLPASSAASSMIMCLEGEGCAGAGVQYKLETEQDAERKSAQNRDLRVQQIQGFLEPAALEQTDGYLLPAKVLLRYALLMDIVRPTCRRSICFTKGYGHYVEGTGSVLQSCMETEISSVFKGLDQLSEEEKLQRLAKLKLRYFTPREIANLMGFPDNFSFPEKISTRQQYRVLGNSLNVLVVARLIQLMVS